MTYQPTIPTGLVNLDVDYQNIQENFSQLDTQFGIDHTAFSNNSTPPLNGYHKAVHMVQQAAPAAVSNVGSLYCTTNNDGLSNDETLYYLTGGNKTIQMTRNVQPSNNATSGLTFLPGGMIMQWGFVTAQISFSAGQTGTVTFPTEFPNDCYTVFTQIAYTSNAEKPGGDKVGNVSVLRSFSPASFSWTVHRLSSGYSRFYWIAIGN